MKSEVRAKCNKEIKIPHKLIGWIKYPSVINSLLIN